MMQIVRRSVTAPKKNLRNVFCMGEKVLANYEAFPYIDDNCFGLYEIEQPHSLFDGILVPRPLFIRMGGGRCSMEEKTILQRF